MIKKPKIQFYLVFISFLVLISSITNVNAIVIGNWSIDIKTYYSVTETVELSTVFLNGSLGPADISYVDYNHYIYEITAIDANLKTVSVTKTHHGVGSIATQFSYDPVVLADNLVNNLFNFEYQIDDDTKELMLTDFEFDYDWIVYLLEPSWDLFNPGFKEIINTSRIIAQVNNGTQLLQVSFDDFISSLEHYSIMGEDDITNSNTKFLDDTVQWTFVFTLDNTMTFYHYISDGDFWERYVYEEYLTHLGFDYSVGGRLQGIRYFKTYTLNTENMTRFLYDQIEIEKTFALFNTISYEYLSAIAVLLILAPIISKRRKLNSLK